MSESQPAHLKRSWNKRVRMGDDKSGHGKSVGMNPPAGQRLDQRVQQVEKSVLQILRKQTVL